MPPAKQAPKKARSCPLELQEAEPTAQRGTEPGGKKNRTGSNGPLYPQVQGHGLCFGVYTASASSHREPPCTCHTSPETLHPCWDRPYLIQ